MTCLSLSKGLILKSRAPYCLSAHAQTTQTHCDGEASRDVHLVISVGASVMARATWQSFGARSEAEVRGFVMQRLRRDVGVMAAREMARHRLTRLACVGVPRHILEQRQQQRFGGRHGMRQPGMLGGLGLDDFYRYQAPLFRHQRP